MYQETVSHSVSNRTIVLLYKMNNMLPMGGGGGNFMNAALVRLVLQSITYLKLQVRHWIYKEPLYLHWITLEPTSTSSLRSDVVQEILWTTLLTFC